MKNSIGIKNKTIKSVNDINVKYLKSEAFELYQHFLRLVHRQCTRRAPEIQWQATEIQFLIFSLNSISVFNNFVSNETTCHKFEPKRFNEF